MSVAFSRAPLRAAKAFYKGGLQWKYPLRRHHFALLRRFVRNTITAIPSFIVLLLAMLSIPLRLAATRSNNRCNPNHESVFAHSPGIPSSQLPQTKKII
jgi:hypothetical protein